MKIQTKKLKGGFSLVEALVAITILIVGVLGPLNIAARGIGDGFFARNQIVANYLAQEAIEIIVNKRYALARKYLYAPPPDEQSLFTWDENLKLCIDGTFCVVSYDDTTFELGFAAAPNCTTDPKCYLVFNTGAGIYMPPASRNQLLPNERGPLFKRKIKLTLNGDDILKAVVTVEWKNKDVDKSLTVVEYLYRQG